jgi:hypothetical protein
MITRHGTHGGRSILVLSCLVIAVACTNGSPSTSGNAPSSIIAAGGASKSSTGVGAGCPASPIPPGIYVNDIKPSDLSKLGPDLAPFGDFYLGTWDLAIGVADPNCYYTSWAVQLVGDGVGFVDAHPFTVIGRNEIALHGADEPIGTYRVSVRDGVLRYFVIDDPSGGRPEALMIGGPWVLQQDGS